MGCKIRKILKLRRQSDTMKIICILTFAEICFFISTIFQLAGIYSYVNSPAEYVLSGDSTISSENINELSQLENGMIISRQNNTPVTIIYHGITTTLDCLMISKEYAENVLGINVIDGTKRFYLNEEAFSEWNRELENNSENTINLENNIQKNKETVLDIKYMTDDEEAKDTGKQQHDDAISHSDDDGMAADIPAKYKSGKLSVIKTGNPKIKLVFTVVETHDLQKNAHSLRVRFKKHDLDGLHVEKMQKLGYSIENEDTVITDEYELKLKLTYIKYNMLCFIICLLSTCVMSHHLIRQYR